MIVPADVAWLLAMTSFGSTPVVNEPDLKSKRVIIRSSGLMRSTALPASAKYGDPPDEMRESNRCDAKSTADVIDVPSDDSSRPSGDVRAALTSLFSMPLARGDLETDDRNDETLNDDMNVFIAGSSQRRNIQIRSRTASTH